MRPRARAQLEGRFALPEKPSTKHLIDKATAWCQAPGSFVSKLPLAPLGARISQIGLNLMKKKSALSIAMVASLAAFSACSSSSESDDAKVDGTEAVAKATAFLTEFEKRPTQIPVTEPLGAEPPASGTIYFVQCGVPACVSLGDALEDATDRLGWNLKRLQGGLTPETIKNAWSQAANANPAPAGVIGSGFNENVIAAEVKALKERGVPAISVSSNDASPVTGNLAASLGSGPARNGIVGAIQAAAVVKDGEGDTDAVFVYSPSLESTVPVAKGFEEKITELCPSCGVDLLEVAPESIGSSLPQEVAAYLQAHPKVRHVGFAFGDMGVGLPKALETSGLDSRVRVVVDTPGTAVSTYMTEGDTFFAATAYPGEEFMWTAVDLILRHQLGQDISPAADSSIPQWLMTPETLPSSTENFPIIEDYQDQFAALWGVK